jgi:hypothetical protein
VHYIQNCLSKLQKGKKATGVFSYFNEMESLISSVSQAKSSAEFGDVYHLKQALAVRAAAIVKDVMSRFSSSKDKPKTKLNDLFAVDLITMSHTHMIYLCFTIFLESIEKKTYSNPKSKEVLLLVAKVFALK